MLLMDADYLRSRLRALCASCDPAGNPLKGRYVVAGKADVSEQYLYQILEGKSAPDGKQRSVGKITRDKISKVFPNWLNQDRANTPLIDLDAHPDLLPIRRVKFKLQAGVQGYAVELNDSDGRPMFFGKEWFASRGFRPERLYAIKVTGASMEPGLFADDIVVVNTDQITPKDGIVFAINYEGEMGIKRLKRDSGEWWLSSDNTDKRRYPDKRCNSDVKILGEVVHKQSERV